jgi:hypothetical protein
MPCPFQPRRLTGCGPIRRCWCSWKVTEKDVNGKADRGRTLRRAAGEDRLQAVAGPCLVLAEQAFELVRAGRIEAGDALDRLAHIFHIVVEQISGREANE